MGWARITMIALLAGVCACETDNPSLGLEGTSTLSIGGTAPEYGLLWNGECAPIPTFTHWYDGDRHYELDLWREGPGLGGHLSMYPAGGEFEIQGWRRSPPSTAKGYTATVDLVPTDGGEVQLEGRFFFAVEGATSLWISLDQERLTAVPLVGSQDGVEQVEPACL